MTKEEKPIPQEVMDVLKKHGLSLQATVEGDLVVDKPPHVFIIRARHEVEITYRVEGTDFNDALAKLCGVELFRA